MSALLAVLIVSASADVRVGAFGAKVPDGPNETLACFVVRDGAWTTSNCAIDVKGWKVAFDGADEERPSIYATQLGMKSKWTKAKLTAPADKSLREAFIAKFADAANCRKNGQREAYAKKDIAFDDVKKGPGGALLVDAHLEKWDCDSESDLPFAEHTFAILADGSVRYIGEWMQLIEARDYDGDGKTEMMFAEDVGFAVWSASFELLVRSH